MAVKRFKTVFYKLSVRVSFPWPDPTLSPVQQNHCLQIKHFGLQVVRSSPWWAQEYNICTQWWGKLHVITDNEFYSVGHVVDCCIMPCTFYFLWVKVNGNHWKIPDDYTCLEPINIGSLYLILKCYCFNTRTKYVQDVCPPQNCIYLPERSDTTWVLKLSSAEILRCVCWSNYKAHRWSINSQYSHF